MLSPAVERDVALAERLREEVRRPFDLVAGLKVRGLLLQTEDDVHVLVVTMHHISSDGWSVFRFVNEISELYRAAISEVPANLPKLTIQYADFSEWQREYLETQELQDQLSYWTRQLGGPLAALELPTDHPRPPMRSYEGEPPVLAVRRPDERTSSRRVRAAGVTPFMFLLASYVAVLARHTGQDDIVVGTAAANRDRPETADLVGLFVNTLAFRVGVDPAATFEHCSRTSSRR